MDLFLQAFSQFGDIFSALWTLFLYGGWVIVLGLIIYIAFKIYLNEIQEQYISTIEWTTFEVFIPRDNMTSLFSVEQIFTQLHILLDVFNMQERFLEGKVMFWMSFEIVSLGGKISFLLRVPKKQRELIESAFYAQYPKAELREVGDYLEKFNYDVNDTSYEFYATEFVLADNQSVPLRTYRDLEMFKSADPDEKSIDPLGPLFEMLSRTRPGEMVAIQYLIRPSMDESWKPDAEERIKKVMGESKFSELTDVSKEKINGIQRKIGKVGFDTKIRLMQLGTTASFNKDFRKGILSPFKIFGSVNGNRIRPAWGPRLAYKISPKLEAFYIDPFVRKRKVELFKAFKSRSMGVGTKPYVLNTEELATIWHLPISIDVPMPLVQTMDSKKIQPPANLPIE